MAKLLLFLALIAVAVAKPQFGSMGHQSHVSTSSHMVNPYGLFGMGFGFPGAVVGHSISSHSVGHHHVMPHYGLGMMGLYPGGMGGYLLG